MTNKVQKTWNLEPNTVELLNTLSYLRGIKQGALLDEIIKDYGMRMDASEKALVVLVTDMANEKGGLKEFDVILEKLAKKIGEA